MTRADLPELLAFWQVGLMDVDHLRDLACAALETDLDCQEFRLIAGDGRLSTDEARDLLAGALRSAGIAPPSDAEAERIVAASVARSVLAGAIDPIWGADLIGEYGSGVGANEERLPTEVWGPLVYASCACCNGLHEMIGEQKRSHRRKECRDDIRRHLAHVLPRIEAWAGLPPSPAGEGTPRPGFLGWRRPMDSIRAELRDLDRRIRWVLLRFWDPIGIADLAGLRDEYDGYALQVQRRLLAGSSEGDLARDLTDYLLGCETGSLGGRDGPEATGRREATVRELLHLRSSW